MAAMEDHTVDANLLTNTPVPLTTEQYNFCRAIDAMRMAPAWYSREPFWLVAHPGDLARDWPEVPVYVCGLRVAEIPACPPGSFYLAGREDYQLESV
jgi:hypothetical protein